MSLYWPQATVRCLECGYASLHAIRERKESLRAADTGVFLGIMNADFSALYTQSGSVYAATGGTISIAAGQLLVADGALTLWISHQKPHRRQQARPEAKEHHRRRPDTPPPSPRPRPRSSMLFVFRTPRRLLPRDPPRPASCCK